MTISSDSETMIPEQGANSSNVKVIVRVRPQNDYEKNSNSNNVIEIMNENILVFDPKDIESPRKARRRPRDIRRRRPKDLKFAYDHIFGWESETEQIFENSTKALLDGLLGGYNCSGMQIKHST